MNILRVKANEVQFDFFLNNLGGAYEAEARTLGCHIYQAPPIRKLGKYLRSLQEVLYEHRYDACHMHGEEFMGDAVRAADHVGVPLRIAHCHSAVLARGKTGIEMELRSWRHKTIDRVLLRRHASDILACSNDAGRFLMGRHWDEDRRCRTLYCGVPLGQFHLASTKWSRSEFREKNAIPRGAIVVGHIGSMGPTLAKNHPFIIDLFDVLARKDKRFFLYLAGDGPHRQALEQKVLAMKLRDKVKFGGLCDDVPSLLVHGIDVHILPSLFEGLPIVGLEAVASGLFTVCSSSITKDFTGYFPERIATLSLAATRSDWAEAVCDGVNRRIPTEEGIALLENSPFSIVQSYQALLKIYQSGTSKTLEPVSG